jgi:hypothetical protein
MSATTEGLYITRDSRALLLKKSKMDVNEIHELTLSEEDGCNLRLAFLRNMLYTDDRYDFLPTEDKDSATIIYSYEGALFVPTCVPVSMVYMGSSDVCIEDLPISFTLGKHNLTGYLLSNGIIKSTTKRADCKEKYFYIQSDNNITAIFNGKTVVLVNTTNIIDLVYYIVY